MRDIRELQGVELMQSGDIYIGAATTFSHITDDPVIQQYIPVLGRRLIWWEASDTKHRNHWRKRVQQGAVSADSAPTLFSLNAMVRTSDGNGGRIIPIEMFYKGPAGGSASRRDCDASGDSGKRNILAIGDITSNIPCAMPWTLQP